MSGNNLITHSRLALANRCLRAHYYRYELGIDRTNTGSPLRIGKAFHAALEYVAGGGDEEGAVQHIRVSYSELPRWCVTPDDMHEWECERELCIAMTRAYLWRWSTSNVLVIANEMEFSLPLRNPATKHPSRKYRLAGKIDKIVQLEDGRMALMEHKTTSDDISDGSDYWRRLRLDNQISIYMLAARMLKYDVQTVLYDVVRKPATQPFKATPIEKRKYKKGGELYANQHDQNEEPESFGMRCYNTMMEDPERYFRREEIPRLESDLVDIQSSLWVQQQRITEARKSIEASYRNPASCLEPYRCAFFDICTNSINPIEKLPDGFVRLDRVHQELEGVST